MEEADISINRWAFWAELQSYTGAVSLTLDIHVSLSNLRHTSRCLLTGIYRPNCWSQTPNLQHNTNVTQLVQSVSGKSTPGTSVPQGPAPSPWSCLSVLDICQIVKVCSLLQVQRLTGGWDPQLRILREVLEGRCSFRSSLQVQLLQSTDRRLRSSPMR